MYRTINKKFHNKFYHSVEYVNQQIQRRRNQVQMQELDSFVLSEEDTCLILS